MPACQRHAKAPTLLCSTGARRDDCQKRQGKPAQQRLAVGMNEYNGRKRPATTGGTRDGGKNGRPGKAKSQLNELASLKNGRGGRTRTRNHRFWRPLFYQLELRPCNKRGELYKAGIKGKGFFSLSVRLHKGRADLVTFTAKGVTRCIYSLVWVGKQRQWG